MTEKVQLPTPEEIEAEKARLAGRDVYFTAIFAPKRQTTPPTRFLIAGAETTGLTEEEVREKMKGEFSQVIEYLFRAEFTGEVQKIDFNTDKDGAAPLPHVEMTHPITGATMLMLAGPIFERAKQNSARLEAENARRKAEAQEDTNAKG